MENFDLHIHSNTDCNLSCKHCYNNSGVGCAERINLDDLYRYLILFSKNYNCDIHLEGGELFLYPELFNVLQKLDESVLKNITITTNGTILLKDFEMLHVLRQIGTLRVSIEGHTQSIHEKVRNSSLEMVLSNARFYQEQGANVVIRVTLNRYNVDTLFTEGVRFLKDKGFSKIQVYEFQEVGRGTQNDFTITCNFAEIFHQFGAISEPVEIKMMLAKRHLSEIRNYNWKKKDVCIQYNGDNNGLSIKANGDVTICSWDEGHVVANFSRMTDSEILNFLSNNSLVHECNFCSKVILQKVNYEN